MHAKNRLNSKFITPPENFYPQIKGEMYIFTFLGPCKHCFNFYLRISRIFQNINFYIYYTSAHFYSNLNNKGGLTFKELRYEYPICFKYINIFVNRLNTKINKPIDENQKISKYLIKDNLKYANELNNCIFHSFLKTKLIGVNNLKIKQIKLSSYAKEILDKLNLV